MDSPHRIVGNKTQSMIAISSLFLDVADRRCINSKNRLLSKEADPSLDSVSREGRVIFFFSMKWLIALFWLVS